MKQLWCSTILFLSMVVGTVPKLAAQSASPEPITADNVINLASLASFPLAEGHDAAIQWSPDGRTIAIASTNGAKTFDLSQSTSEPAAVMGKGTYAKCADYVPDRSIIATCSALSSTVWLWDRHTGEKLATLANGTDLIEYARFSPNGRLLAVINGFEKAIYIWAVNGGADVMMPTNARQIERLAVLANEGSPINMSFSPDGSTLATTSNDKTLRLWDLASMKLKSSQAYDNTIWALAYSPDGQWLALGGYATNQGYIRLLNLTDPNITRDLNPLQAIDLVIDVNFSPDGKLLVSAQNDGQFTIWDINAGEALRTIKVGASMTRQAAFNHDGTLLATLNMNESAQIWGMADGLSLIPKPSLTINAQAVVVSTLNMRTAVGTNADLVLQLTANTVVTIIDGPTEADDITWWKVRNADGIEGWVAESINGLEKLRPDY